MVSVSRTIRDLGGSKVSLFQDFHLEYQFPDCSRLALYGHCLDLCDAVACVFFSRFTSRGTLSRLLSIFSPAGDVFTFDFLNCSGRYLIKALLPVIFYLQISLLAFPFSSSGESSPRACPRLSTDFGPAVPALVTSPVSSLRGHARILNRVLSSPT